MKILVKRLFFFCLALSLPFCLIPQLHAAATWSCVGPDGGDFRGIAANTTNSLEVTVFTSSPNSVWHSSDGISWSYPEYCPRISKFAAGAPGHFYVLCSEDNQYYSYFSYSENGGKDWIYHQYDNVDWHLFCLDPANPSRVFAILKHHGFYICSSENGGADFYNIQSNLTTQLGSWNDMAIARTNGNRILACGGMASRPVGTAILSNDSGSNWTDLTLAIMPDLIPSSSTMQCVAIDPTNADRMYIAGSAFHRTEDGGKTWSKTSESGTDYGIRAIWIDPLNTAHICMGGSRISYVSDDYGKTWKQYPMPPCGQWNYLQSPLGKSMPLYLAASSRLLRSDDGGCTWSSGDDGLKLVSNAALVCHPTLPEKVLVATETGILYRSEDRGISWDDFGIYIPPSPLEINMNPANPDSMVLTAGDFNGVYKTMNAGMTWTKSTFPGSEFPIAYQGIARDAMDPNVLFYIATVNGEESKTTYTIQRLYKSDDDGLTWDILCKEMQYTTDSLSANLSLSPNTSSTLYSCGYRDHGGFYHPQSMCIFRSLDGGRRWSEITNNLVDCYYYYWSEAYWIAEIPCKADILCLGTDQGIYRSTDAGATWKETSINDDCPARVIDPKTKILYIGSAIGVYFTRDGGATWLPANKGLNTSDRIVALAIDSLGDYLYAAVSPGAIWRLRISPVSAASAEWEQYR